MKICLPTDRGTGRFLLPAALTMVLAGSLAAQGTHTPFGKGCPGSKGVPMLTARGNHEIGGSTTARITNLPPGQPGYFSLGLSDRQWGSIKLPLDLTFIGMAGCSLYVSQDLLVPLGTQNGTTEITIPHPNDAKLVGISYFHQYVAADPGAKTPLKVIATNAGKVTLGRSGFSVGAFNYQDPYPAKFHPLRSPTYLPSHRVEVSVLVSRGGRSDGVTVDDHTTNHKLVASPGALLSGLSVLATADGDWDGQAGEELVVAGHSNSALDLRVLHMRNGVWREADRFTSPAPRSTDRFRQVSLALADVNADGRDDLVVAAQLGSGGFIRIFDSRTATVGGVKPPLKHVDVKLSDRLTVHTGNLDQDPGHEILVAAMSSIRRVLLLDDAAQSFRTLGTAWGSISAARRVVLGNFDGVAGDEVATLTLGASFPQVIVHKLQSNGSLKPTYSRSVASKDFYFSQATSFPAAAAGDTDGDGVDEIVVVAHTGLSSFLKLTQLALIDGLTSTAKVSDGVLSLGAGHQLYRLAIGDDDGDGRAEFRLGSASGTTVRTWRYEDRLVLKDRVSKTVGVNLGAGTTLPWLDFGDFDADSLILRYTGKKTLHLADPMPIVVMAAPPTKSGISQNYTNTGSSFRQSQSRSTSHGVSTGWSASVSAGYETEVLGLFGASVKATVSAEMQKTLTHSKQITYTTTYSGSYDQDTVVFQGTLYHCYEYEIVGAADPKTVGQKITLNDPVASKVYKWTLDYYNSTFPLAQRIGKATMNHLIGDPKTYYTKKQASDRLLVHQGWMDATGKTVGQGSSTNGTGIELTNQRSTEKSRSFSVGVESEFKIGGAAVGASFGISKGEIYGVSVAEGTAYEGTVGDIGASDWSRWQYDFGLLIYKHGTTSSGANIKGQQAFHVLTYWTNPVGSGY